MTRQSTTVRDQQNHHTRQIQHIMPAAILRQMSALSAACGDDNDEKKIYCR